MSTGNPHAPRPDFSHGYDAAPAPTGGHQAAQQPSPVVWNDSHGQPAPVPGPGHGPYPPSGPYPGGPYPAPAVNGVAAPPVPDLSGMDITANTLGKNQLTFFGMVRSELIKFTSIRSTWIVLAFALVLSTLVAWGTVQSSVDYIKEDSRFEKLEAYLLVLPSTEFLKILIPILALLAVTAEYKSGQIRSVLTACPKRGVAYSAKFCAILPFVLIAHLIIFASVVAVEYLILVKHNMTDQLNWHSFWYNCGTAFAQVLFTCVILMTLGYLLRSTALAMTLFVAAHFILPQILLAISNKIVKWVGSHMPASALNFMWDRQADFFIENETLSRAEAWVTIIAWIVVLLAASFLVFRQRDA